MHKNKKFLLNKLFSLILIAVLIMNSVPFVYGSYSPVYNNEAVRLNRLGLFLGTGNGFELEKTCNRLQGAVMFIRLVGEEKTALEESPPFPFEDISQEWAKPYVGQMYANGYAKGTSETTFGTGAMGANEFSTYILRALGYSEAEGDFLWSSALFSLLDLGIISSRDFNIISKGYFYRDYAAKLASSALDAKLKNEDSTLLESLNKKGVITNYSNLKPPVVSAGTSVRSYEDMQSVFQRMHANLQYSATLDTDGLYLSDIKKWLNMISDTSSSDVWGWKIVSTYTTDNNSPSKVVITWLYSDGYEVAYSYLYPDSSPPLSYKNQEIRDVVDQFMANEISYNMTKKEKIKAVHDYLVRTTKYDTSLAGNTPANSNSTSDSYKAYGVIVKHLGVCDGYAKAFNMFMDILGIPSERVVGFSYFNNTSVNHAWNRVYLDYEYLNLDVTWDDPVPDRGNKISYDYYLITDERLRSDHTWNDSQFDVKYY